MYTDSLSYLHTWWHQVDQTIVMWNVFCDAMAFFDKLFSKKIFEYGNQEARKRDRYVILNAFHSCLSIFEWYGMRRWGWRTKFPWAEFESWFLAEYGSADAHEAGSAASMWWLRGRRARASGVGKVRSRHQKEGRPLNQCLLIIYTRASTLAHSTRLGRHRVSAVRI